MRFYVGYEFKNDAAGSLIEVVFIFFKSFEMERSGNHYYYGYGGINFMCI